MKLRVKEGRLFAFGVCAVLLAVAAIYLFEPGEEGTAKTQSFERAASVASPGLPPPPADPQLALLGSDSSISPTPHALILVATEPGTSPRNGRASLGTDVRNPQTYAAGAMFANGTILEEIYADYVVLGREGKRFVLPVAGGPTPAIARSLPIADRAVFVGGDDSVKRPLERVPTSRIDISDAIRAEPFFERDEFAGLRILPGTDRSKLDLLELQSGDIVRAIDGKPVKAPDESWQALDDAISTNTPIVVSIDRQGTLLSVSLDGSRLGATAAQVPSPDLALAAPGT